LTDPHPENLKKIFLAGSSHTRLFFPAVKRCLLGRASVSKLSYDAGNTVEILNSLHDWPLEDKDIVHVYAGHRDLIRSEAGQPIVSPGQFKNNMHQIIDILIERTNAELVFSNIPPVAESFLEIAPRRNEQISWYNTIIEDVTRERMIPVHDFSGFVLSYSVKQEIYSDGLHFTRKFYNEFGVNLAEFLIKLI